MDVAIRPGASGDISLKEGEESNEYVAWYQRMGGPHIPSPIAYGKNLYVLYHTGIFGAFDALTGKQIYKARIGEGAHAFSSSPWACNGKIYCLSEDGDTFVIEAGDQFKRLGKNSLEEMSLATPAIAQSSLFIRTATKLYRIRGGESEGRP